ncbi:RNA-binding protein [Candidatus Kuenenbacteria bacterium HGW-Kuenenbacteria-1]|uniref:RNA-binding protein KhpA n=1 Tax=Candidatus Kuenenbacteria bacterium HGW-Kuenenbacteria-1 TaxID=2013812 RepID=A0A2N1UP03_9BACT|nr:MAG: RNA-binding protein [Candidatus Kuenenbacteria bacterium HGW-Kuenenbacteria-1]
MTTQADQAFIEMIVKSLVNKPEAVTVERTVDEMGVLLTLKVDVEDTGQIIGRSGQTIQAIRTLLRIVGAKNNARVNLKLYQPEGTERPFRRDTRSDAKVTTADAIDDFKI